MYIICLYKFLLKILLEAKVSRIIPGNKPAVANCKINAVEQNSKIPFFHWYVNAIELEQQAYRKDPHHP